MSRPRAARAAGAQLGKGLRDRVESKRFAREVRVRAEVIRQVVLDVRELPIERDQQIHQPWRLVGRRIGGEQFHGPRPRQSPKRRLEHAGPVDTVFGRIRLDPALELGDEGVTIPALAREPVRTPECAPVLVPVQLPDDLVIAARRIEIRNGCPELQRSGDAVYRVPMPVRRCAAIDITIAEQIVPASRERIAAPASVPSGVGKAFADNAREIVAGRGCQGPHRPTRQPVAPERAVRCQVICARQGEPCVGNARCIRSVQKPFERGPFPPRPQDDMPRAANHVARFASDPELEFLAVHSRRSSKKGLADHAGRAAATACDEARLRYSASHCPRTADH